jgi:hypothetical protein
VTPVANTTTAITSSTSAVSTSTAVITPTLTATHTVSSVASATPTGAAQSYKEPKVWDWMVLAPLILAALEI